jgi:hypothetical protein
LPQGGVTETRRVTDWRGVPQGPESNPNGRGRGIGIDRAPDDWGLGRLHGVAGGGGNRGIAGSAGFIGTTGAVVVAAGLGLAVLRFVGGTPAEQGVEGAIGSLALGAAVAAPGVLAVLALDSRPALLLPAAIVLVPLSFLSFALVTLPLLIPAGMLLVGYGRRSVGQPPPVGSAVGTCAAVLLTLAAAVVVLFVHQDPRSYTTATGGGSTSDVITFAESLFSLALTAAAVAVAWALSAPRRDAVRTDRSNGQ